MKKVIGIYTFYLGNGEPVWDEGSNNLGGSETWTIRVAEEFAKLGYHVIVFGNPTCWHFVPYGDGTVEYTYRDYFKERCQYQHFDYFISSRVAEELSPDIQCENIYIMSHEARINGAGTYQDLKPNLFKKIICLSDWHADMLVRDYPGLERSRISLSFNGVDRELYLPEKTPQKRNMMVWSSCKERGLKYFIDAVFPCVKRMVPDFELVVCSYNNDVPESYATLPGIRIVGRLSKQELANLQLEAKIWAYLNYGIDEETGYPAHETFCITAVENGMAGNALICSNASGLDTTLRGYSGLVGTDLDLSFNNMNAETRNQLKNEIVAKIVHLLYEDESGEECQRLGTEAKEICSKYVWRDAAKSILRIMGENA